jgi:WASH complex subunit strumpellin
MLRTVNVKKETLAALENVADFSFAWRLMLDYIPVAHEKIRSDPSAVVLLRATFLKTCSILDVPLVRVVQVDSPDTPSIAEFYSSELVDFVRKVLEIIPISVFQILNQVVDVSTNQMTPLPTRVETQDLKTYAQLDQRYELARLTHQASIFTDGILLMEKTLLGVIQVS